VLGHINTFGGHPVCCAAGFAAMEILLAESLISQVREKERLFLNRLIHPKIKNVRSRGLMIAVEFKSFAQNKNVIDRLIDQGVFTDWFLFAPDCLRIVPPLTISAEEISAACYKIIYVLDNIQERN
jgi:acetylornithine/succinyldiaminopimelate/putrescine aminotransferase